MRISSTNSTASDIDKLPPGVLVYAIEGPFFFGAVENFERVLLETHTDPRVLVLRLRRVPFMDITGLQTLEEVIQQMTTARRAGVVVRGEPARLPQAGKRRRVRGGRPRELFRDLGSGVGGLLKRRPSRML